MLLRQYLNARAICEEEARPTLRRQFSFSDACRTLAAGLGFHQNYNIASLKSYSNYSEQVRFVHLSNDISNMSISFSKDACQLLFSLGWQPAKTFRKIQQVNGKLIVSTKS